MSKAMDNRNGAAQGLLARVYRFYRDGFRQMTVGRTLWKIIFIKLFVMFAVLKAFFFPDFLATTFTDDRQRADHVIEQLTQSQRQSSNPGRGE